MMCFYFSYVVFVMQEYKNPKGAFWLTQHNAQPQGLAKQWQNAPFGLRLSNKKTCGFCVHIKLGQH